MLDEEEEETKAEDTQEHRKGFSPPFWDFLIYLGFLATFSAVVYAGVETTAVRRISFLLIV